MSPKPLSGDAFHDPSNTGPRTTQQIRDGGTFSVYASIAINAPTQVVYDAILDVQKWHEWNTFVPKVDITGHPHPHKGRLKMMEGTNMTFHVQMTPDEQTTSKETCSHCEPLKLRTKHGSMPLANSLPHEPSLPDNLTSSAKGTEFLGKAPLTRIRWNLHNASIMTPGWVIKAERVSEIEEAEDGTTLYRTWEAFGGLAASHVKKKYGEVLQARFQDWCRDLKKYAEGKREGGSEGAE
ncbi:hypothetical protein D0863_00488 [Hortaea werneckii]|uniref:Coenzyme Q-binding protein COQ10 START domain-containing protein n=1 Tax=Hortaea werneckii TaxID=91943 RepID=A0A3M7EQH9_HORWE|nr:hypothetical protein D0863_00488 [Hortaea werneckii]